MLANKKCDCKSISKQKKGIQSSYRGGLQVRNASSRARVVCSLLPQPRASGYFINPLKIKESLISIGVRF